MTHKNRHLILVLCGVISIPLIPLIINLGSLVIARYSEYSDLTISHLPYAIYIRDSILNVGLVPLWTDALFSGMPLGANPLAGLWYPPGWLAILLPAPYGYNILFLLHILWGALGLFVFLRRLGLGIAASLLGAVSFAWMPKISAHFGAGHVSLIYAVTWTPWLLLNTFRNVKNNNRIKDLLVTATVLGVIALADVRWFVYALGIWFITYIWFEFKRQKTTERLTTFFRNLVLIILGSLAFASVQLLPLLEFVRLSTRSGLAAEEKLAISLPFDRLLGIFFPDWGGYAEWVIYPGALILCLTIFSIARPEIRKKTFLWIVIGLMSLLISLGENVPGMKSLVSIPFVDLLRVPPRIMFLGGISLSIVAAFGFDELLKLKVKPPFDPVFFMVPVAAFGIFTIIGLIFTDNTIPPTVIWGTAAFIISILLIFLAERQKLAANLIYMSAILIVGLDLGVTNQLSIRYTDLYKTNSQSREVIDFLVKQPGDFRIYSPSYSISQFNAAVAGIDLVSGIDPLQIQAYANFLEEASGIPSDGYSVVLPPISGKIRIANKEYTPRVDLLAMLNVRYVVASYPITTDDLTPVWNNEDNYIYEIAGSSGVAWGLPGDVPGEGDVKIEKIIDNNPHKKTFIVTGHGYLVLSMPSYPGWVASSDGEVLRTEKYLDVFPMIKIPEGTHTLSYEFKPRAVYWGLLVSGFSWTIFLAVFFFCRRRTGESR